MPPADNINVGVSVWLNETVAGGGPVLLMRRIGNKTKFQDGAGTWSLPGGWMEFGEQPEETAERECMEELGITISNLRRRGFVVDQSDDLLRWKVTLVLSGNLAGGEPRVLEPEKCSDVLWITPGHFPPHGRLFPPLASFIEKYGKI